jgi:hypothetical protein
MGQGLLSVIASVRLAAPDPVNAEPPTPAADAAVIWRAPAGCPDDAAIEQRITALVGEPPVTTPATAQVRHAGDRYEVELVTWIDGGSQRRELAATSCAALADVVAVVIAVSLDPVITVVRAPVVANAVRTAAIRDDRGAIPAIARRSKDRGPRAPLQIGFAIGAGYGSGVARRGSAVTHLGFELGRSVRVLGWGVVIDARLWLPREFAAADPSVRVSTLLGTVGLLGCVKGNVGRVELPVCLGAEVGGFRARGRSNLSGGGPASYPWVAPRLRLGVRVPVARRVALWAAAEGAVPVLRARIDAGDAAGTGTDTLWRTQPVSVRVMLGLDFRWLR